MNITYEKTFQGAHKFYAMVGDQLITKQYFFTSKREALRDFKELLKEEALS